MSAEDTQAIKPTPKEELLEYKKHAHLKGQNIAIAEASCEYSLDLSTIQRWIKNGYIIQLGQDGQMVLIDEADLAYCAETNRKNGGQGKW